MRTELIYMSFKLCFFSKCVLIFIMSFSMWGQPIIGQPFRINWPGLKCFSTSAGVLAGIHDCFSSFREFLAVPAWLCECLLLFLGRSIDLVKLNWFREYEGIDLLLWYFCFSSFFSRNTTVVFNGSFQRAIHLFWPINWLLFALWPRFFCFRTLLCWPPELLLCAWVYILSWSWECWDRLLWTEELSLSKILNLFCKIKLC